MFENIKYWLVNSFSAQDMDKIYRAKEELRKAQATVENSEVYSTTFYVFATFGAFIGIILTVIILIMFLRR